MCQPLLMKRRRLMGCQRPDATLLEVGPAKPTSSSALHRSARRGPVQEGGEGEGEEEEEEEEAEDEVDSGDSVLAPALKSVPTACSVKVSGKYQYLTL